MIFWNPDLVAFSVGPLTVRWYSLLWCIGLAVAYYIVMRLYKKQGIPEEKFDPLFFYCFVGILIGARLGHCLLYEPAYFLAHPLEMFLPIRFDEAGALALCEKDGGQLHPRHRQYRHCNAHHGVLHSTWKPHEF